MRSANALRGKNGKPKKKEPGAIRSAFLSFSFFGALAGGRGAPTRDKKISRSMEVGLFYLVQYISLYGVTLLLTFNFRSEDTKTQNTQAENG